MKKLFLPCALLALAALSACAPSRQEPPAPDPAYSQQPANDFERAFAAQPGVRPIKFGGWIQTLTPGNGPSPDADSVVTVNYRGTLPDGKEFDSSYARGQPATFSLRHVIQCWTFGVPMMKVGEKAKLVCPANVAYGDRGSPPVIPPGATLAFEIELLRIDK